jgi:hypothetical protein
MSGNLEGIIRPFQLPDFSPPRKAPDSQYTPIRNPILNCGANGSCKTMGGSFSLTQTYYMINRPKEEQQQQ